VTYEEQWAESGVNPCSYFLIKLATCSTYMLLHSTADQPCHSVRYLYVKFNAAADLSNIFTFAGCFIYHVGLRDMPGNEHHTQHIAITVSLLILLFADCCQYTPFASRCYKFPHSVFCRPFMYCAVLPRICLFDRAVCG
jgi:hypothetical protein